ncbi:MAG TPA: C40 family peptidase, partial [Pseudonocardiaceae bacterium]
AIKAAGSVAQNALRYACDQRGLPYVWGGNGPSDGGFDCSGLTSVAYSTAGVKLPRTADAQFRAGPQVPAGQPLHVGDLVFFGNESDIHHVGIYLGAGMMLDAPDFGQVVKIESYQLSDYFGATRPAAAASA